MSLKSIFFKTSAALSIIPASLGLWLACSITNVRDIQIKAHEVSVKQGQIPSLKLCFMADNHIGLANDIDDLAFSAAYLNKQACDIVLLGGDYVFNRSVFRQNIGTYNIQDIAHELGKIQSTYGVFATLGNHDWEIENPNALIAAMEAEGITVLENQNSLVEFGGGQKLAIAVVSDFSSAPMGPDFAAATEGLDQDTPLLMLSHDPKAFVYSMPETPNYNILLLLAGHTHCGQISYIGQYALARAQTPENMYGGRFAHNGIDGVVTCGMGNSTFDFRTIPYQIDTIRLKPKTFIASRQP